MVNLGLPFTIEELLKFWQSTWFQLSETQQQKFLKQPEAQLLCQCPRTEVEKFLKTEKKLRIVLMNLRAESQRIKEADARFKESEWQSLVMEVNGYARNRRNKSATYGLAPAIGGEI